jgi:pathogenesis-related protein 1
MGNGFGMGGQGNATGMTAGGAMNAGGIPAMTIGTGGGPAPGGMTGSSGGVFGSGGGFGSGGVVGMGGTIGAGGTQGGTAGSQGGTTGIAGTTGMTGANPEMGRLVGITAAHNVVRAAVQTMPPLAPLVWSDTLAAYAQQWADSLAMTSCASPHHRTEQELQQKGYGENLAAFSSTRGSSTAQQAVDGWASEKMCWTFGTFFGTEKCDMSCYAMLNSDGCGHYTQIVWRKSTQLGCGVASCMNGQFKTDIWICNYAPPGNYVGQNPY